jgi:methionyl-tRNA formyltransferase
MGSGSIGLPVLTGLARSQAIRLLGVATQPDRPAGRHGQLHPTPVGALARSQGWAVETPQSVNAPEFLAHLRHLQPHLVVVVAFGQILKADLLALPAFGCLNVHASLLPRHRGAAPVSAAILAGDRETGVSFMKMDRGLDTGPVYRRFPVSLRGDETTGSLEARLAELAAAGIVACVEGVCRGREQPVPQPAVGVTHAAKLTKRDGELDWSLSAVEIERRVRAFIPWPRVCFRLPQAQSGRRIQITAAAVVAAADGAAGQVLQADADGWVVACGHASLRLIRLVPEGRREMTAAEFLRGCRVPVGLHLWSNGSENTRQV